MILQALNEYYGILRQKGEAAGPGWSSVKVSFALVLTLHGELRDVMPLQAEVEKKNGKTAKLPQVMLVPEQVKRSSGVNANFLCDGPAYLLGLDGKEAGERAVFALFT